MSWSASDKLIKQIRVELEQLSHLVRENQPLISTAGKSLTDEWDMRGANLDIEYAILTNDIMKGTFNKSVEGYKRHKGLERENLRDHMNDLELILTMLALRPYTKDT